MLTCEGVSQAQSQNAVDFRVSETVFGSRPEDSGEARHTRQPAVVASLACEFATKGVESGLSQSQRDKSTSATRRYYYYYLVLVGTRRGWSYDRW